MGNKIKVLIYGIAGRMGKLNAECVHKNSNLELCAGIVEKGSPFDGKNINEVCAVNNTSITVSSNLEEELAKCDVVIDFTCPEATIEALRINKKHKKAFVIGTTGLNDKQNQFVKEASEMFPIVYAPNYSIGVNVLFKLTKIASKLLNKEAGYDLEIIEAHHRYKKDAPSGTAKRLLEISAENSGRTTDNAVYGRKGFTGERNITDIGVNVIRAGDIVGEHTLLYSTEGERVEITHKAHSREAFSNGACTAVIFVKDKTKGLYTMEDILFGDE